MTTNYLAPKSTPDSRMQARFSVQDDCCGSKVHVFQITGAASHTDRIMPVNEARAIYKSLLDRGWTEPVHEHRHSLRVLRGCLR